jgi:hypothetical protein
MISGPHRVDRDAVARHIKAVGRHGHVANVAIVSTIAVATLFLAACGGTDAPAAAPPATVAVNDQSPTPAPTPTPTPKFNYPLTTISVPYTSSDGYSYSLEIDLGKVIPWTDTAASTAAWKSVGGTDAPPCSQSNPAYTTGGVPARAGHAYGTLKITNKVPQFGPGNVRIGFVPPSRFDGDAVGWVTSSGGDCVAMVGGDALTANVVDNQATWGPVPFDVVIGDYLSPNHPTGDPSLIAGNFQVSLGFSTGTSFSLKPYTP